MNNLKLVNIFEVTTKTLVGDHGIDFSRLPNLSKLLKNVKVVSEDDFNDLIKLDSIDIQILELILDSDFSKTFGNTTSAYRVYSLFKMLCINIKNGQLSPNQKKFYVDVLHEIYFIAEDILDYNPKAPDAPKAPKQSKPVIDMMTISQFKNLSKVISSTPAYGVDDSSFKELLDPNNQEAQSYYDAIQNDDDGLRASNTPIGKVYNMYQSLRSDCNETVKTHTILKDKVSQMNDYYGINDTKDKQKSTKEFHEIKSLNMGTLGNGDLIELHYRLIDPQTSKPYQGVNTVYYSVFTYYPRTYTYLLVNTKDLNNFFIFTHPKPNPINVGGIYNVEYNSLVVTKGHLKLQVTNIKTQKTDVIHEFPNCAAIEELKELMKSIVAHRI